MRRKKALGTDLVRRKNALGTDLVRRKNALGTDLVHFVCDPTKKNGPVYTYMRLIKTEHGA